MNQLNRPFSIFIDKNQNIFIADYINNRIMKWKPNENQGTIVAGGNGQGNRKDQLSYPTDMIVDVENNSLIICDQGNHRVIRWFNQNEQEILVENIYCIGLAIDKYGYFYAPDCGKHEVRRWKIGEKNEGKIVAGGNGKGNLFNQLHCPVSLFVNDEQSIYVSDHHNHRIIKWRKDASEGVVVAGGNDQGNNLNQLQYPFGLIVDEYDQIYVADNHNHRVMRWAEGKKEGEIVVGGNGNGNQSNQLSHAFDLSFDVEGNLFVADWANNRIQRFDLIF